MGAACAGQTQTESKTETVKTGPPEEEPPATEPAPAEPEAGPKHTIKILAARGVRKADWLPGTGTSDCYVTDEQEVEIDSAEAPSLEFSVWDEDTGKKPDSLGKAVLKNDQFASNGFNGELELEGAGKGVKAYIRIMVKPPGKEYPAGPAGEFTIKFDKDPKAKGLGLEIDDADGKYLYIVNVKPGAFKTYNDKPETEKDKQVRPGDFIVKVNGTEGDASALLTALKENNSLEIVVKHPEEFTVAIKKGDAKAGTGLEFPKDVTGSAVLITKINAGPFQEWNKHTEQHGFHEVRPGDRIVSVAGFQGKAKDVQKKMTTIASFQAVIVRPAELGSKGSNF